MNTHDHNTAKALVKTLLTQMRAAYPTSSSAWADPAVFTIACDVWGEALALAGSLNAPAIKRGWARCLAQNGAFLPAVGDFVRWCQPLPEDLGLPGVEQAYREATTNAHPANFGAACWSHETVYHAALAVGLSPLCSMPEKVTRPLFHARYVEACALFAGGAVLSKPRPAVTGPTKAQECDKAQGQAVLAAIRQRLNLKPQMDIARQGVKFNAGSTNSADPPPL